MSDGFASPIEAIEAFYGTTPKITPWVLVEQATIDKFAETTGDHNWLHVDPERAKRESPFGTTVAHGFWTMSMCAYFAQQASDQLVPAGALHGLNYGIEKLRFMVPVRIGKKIRCIITLKDIGDRRRGRYLVRCEYKVEVEDESRPAMVADWLTLFTFPES